MTKATLPARPRFDCPGPRDLIDFCIGKLADEAIDSVAGHLDDCPTCLATVEMLEKVPIPFVGYHLSDSGAQTVSPTLDPHYQRLLGLLKQIQARPAEPPSP